MQEPQGPAPRRTLMAAGLAVLIATALISSGCGTNQTREVNIGPLPASMAGALPIVVDEYRWAAAHHEELQYIPCYCGCGEFGHASNSACYFKRDAAGTIVDFDNHAVG